MNKRLKEIMNRKLEIRKMLESDEKIDMDAIEEELRALEQEAKEIERRTGIANSITNNELPTQSIKKPMEKEKDARCQGSSFDTMEYRNAFMRYVTAGEALPAEYRKDAVTDTKDVAALVPPVTLNKIVEKIEAWGMILPLVNKTAYKTGMIIPVASIKPVASWVAEGAGNDRQKLPLDASITFGHFKLRCAVSVTLETENMTYPAFEARLVSSISVAMAKALEMAILTGTGSGQPQGILTDADKVTTIESAKLDYKTLVNAEAALPMEYEANAVWVMTKKTFMEFVGMTDTNGQPVARVDHGIGAAPERTLLGRRVILTNYLPVFSATAKKTDVYAMIYDFSDYTLNTNFSIGMKVYEDDDTDDIVRKSIMVADGKPVLYDSLVKLTGTAEAASAAKAAARTAK